MLRRVHPEPRPERSRRISRRAQQEPPSTSLSTPFNRGLRRTVPESCAICSLGCLREILGLLEKGKAPEPQLEAAKLHSYYYQ